MLGTQNLPLFIGAVIALSATPGPDMIYIVSRSMSQGRSAGIASVLGISTALLCHSLVIAFGLSSLLAASQLAFDVVRYLGAVYLLYLAVQTWKEASRSTSLASPSSITLTPQRQIYRQGFVTGLLNPKTTLFFAALLPQFVAPNVSNALVPLLFLGVLVVAVGGTCDMLVALLSGKLSKTLGSSGRFRSWSKRFTSAIYVGLALNLLRFKHNSLARL